MIQKGREVLNRLKISKREWLFGGCAAVFLLLLTVNYFNSTTKHSDTSSSAWDVSPAKPVLNTTEQPQKQVNRAPSAESHKKEIVVDVKGSVKSPGVYKMREGDRVLDAVEKAGGFADTADRSLINLAKLLQDEMVIVVPKKGEKPKAIPNGVGSAAYSANAASSNGKVSVNTANEKELESLPGIGPVTAKAIITYRKKHGRFRNVNDLIKVPGIGEKTVQSFKDSISF
ncbi:MAG TPA: helix-hairpin-helix domain-containing protein [Bacillales bacterium]|nr:helix-hairpin-helix domain-containing protein [Bacillales bacterium]